MKFGIFLLLIGGFWLCGSGGLFSAQAQTELTPEQRAALQQELAQVEAEQKQAAKELVAAQGKSASLARDIAVLDAKIRTAQLNIKAKNILIQSLGNDISKKVTEINNLEERIERGKDTLSQLLRKTNEIDDLSMPELILSRNTVTELMQDFDSFQSVQESLKITFEQLKSDKASTTEEKEHLDARRNAELDARYEIQQQQKNIESNKAEQKQLLALSKGAEQAYTKLIADKQARAAQIRSALFSLRDAASIPFGQALQYATLASQKTGVRPAFILAVITQESNLGSNVGKCYVTNMQTGAGVNAKTGAMVSNVMSPKRDVPPFIQILKEIGGEPSKQVVSCPFTIGWGGAMGPAQFIASTWMLIKDRVANAVGVSGMPDPWNPAHAFMASAIYLGDLGASNQTYTSERNAACKYYSGRACGLVTGNTTYGNSVVALADKIQRTMIDPLQGL
jgi:membrane-bound lytic murein transglycosylase B